MLQPSSYYSYNAHYATKCVEGENKKMVEQKVVNTVLAVAVTLAAIPIVQGFIDDANLSGGLALLANLVPLVMIFGIVGFAAGAFRR